MPGKGKKKYSKKQMKIARVAEPRDRITGADFRKKIKIKVREKKWLNFVQKVKLLLNESLKYIHQRMQICTLLVYVVVE